MLQTVSFRCAMNCPHFYFFFALHSCLIYCALLFGNTDVLLEKVPMSRSPVLSFHSVSVAALTLGGWFCLRCTRICVRFFFPHLYKGWQPKNKESQHSKMTNIPFNLLTLSWEKVIAQSKQIPNVFAWGVFLWKHPFQKQFTYACGLLWLCNVTHLFLVYVHDCAWVFCNYGIHHSHKF